MRAFAAGLGIAILIAASAGEAQPTAPAAPAPPSPASDVVAPLARHEIARRIEESFRDLQDLAPALRRSPDYLRIRDAIPTFRERITLLSADPALERLDTLHPASLHDLVVAWGREQSHLRGWQSTLEGRAQQLGEERERVLRARRLWRVTLDAERDDPLNAAQRVRIDNLLEEMRRVKTRLDTRSEEILDLQAQLSDEGLRIAATVARIGSAQRAARRRRSERDRRPVWEGWAREPSQPTPASIDEVAAVHAASIAAFVETERNALAAHAVLGLALAALLLWLRRRARGLAPRHRPSAHLALRARPLASALVLGLAIAPILYPNVPAVIFGGALVALAPALFALGPHMLGGARRPVFTLVALGALVVPLNLGLAPDPLRPTALLVSSLAAIAAGGWLSWPTWRRPIDAAPRGARRLYRLAQASVLPLAVALYFLLVGHVERAQLWIAASLAAVQLAVGLFFATELFAALVREALRRPLARQLSFTVQRRRLRAARLLVRLVRGGALAVFGYLVLTGFDVLDPALEVARMAMREELTFGEIRLTGGDVLAFVAMILGTLLVMRVVHSLLDLEILPRFSLEQGIASAISLSVSYLLVAIGVVLAFGVAGVGPERLALLGGALGVGIGFGLQNVVSNFVSGLILVAERPIKVGDIIELGPLVGTVRRIGIRSSTVASLDGAEVIVPNADLISGRLVNWTLTDARRRLELVVGTSYAGSPERARALLLEVVSSQPGVLHDPPPDVICVGFGASSIDFAIRAWTAGYREAIQIKSRLAVRVHAALEREGIEIPFPQRDLHLRSVSAEAVKELRPDRE